MIANRISSADARTIPSAKMYSFDEYSRKASIRAGQYYKIIADSPDSGIVISDKPIEGFMRAEYNCRIGKVSGIENCATCIFPDP
jgi:hypothetical protein